MAKILIIDDDAAFAEGLEETLHDLGHETRKAASAALGLRLLEVESVDLIFIDYRMPGMDGLQATQLIRQAKETKPIPIVMITAHVSSETTIQAMKLGAFDHLIKPVSRSGVERVINSALKTKSHVPAPVTRRTQPDDLLVGQSEAMREIHKLIGRIALTRSSVLITGETGTGKEMVAKALHLNGDRANHELVAINCAAIPENLLESELFGHVRGAFTGATSDRVGSFKRADGGTIFLDEIGDMSGALQAKMLRVLQEREVTPLGSSKPFKVDVRVLAATHQDLGSMVEKKLFREDLYYRLNVVEIHLPPLRDRAEDVPLLTAHFLSQLNSTSGLEPKELTQEAQTKLLHHSWPGNVRELKNVIERAFITARTTWIEEADIRFLNDRANESGRSDGHESHKTVNLDLPSAIARVEKDLIIRALAQTRGNRTEAARLLGIQRQHLYTKLKEHRVDIDRDSQTMS